MKINGYQGKNSMKNISITFFLLFTCAVLHAQTAAELETLLAANKVTYGQAARFILQAADNGEFQHDEAFQFTSEKAWVPKSASLGKLASLEGVSLLIMRSFNMKGGAFYTMFKNPHYAYRELIRQKIIQGRADPQMSVSGELLLFLVNRVLERKEGGNQ